MTLTGFQVAVARTERGSLVEGGGIQELGQQLGVPIRKGGLLFYSLCVVSTQVITKALSSYRREDNGRCSNKKLVTSSYISRSFSIYFFFQSSSFVHVIHPALYMKKHHSASDF